MTTGIISMTLRGTRNAQRQFTRSYRQMRKKHARRGVNRGAAHVRTVYRNGVPQETGRLARNVRSKARRGGRTYVKASVMIQVGGGRDDPGDAFYWRFLEYGTQYIDAQPFLERLSKQAFPKTVRIIFGEVNRGLKADFRSGRL